MAVGTLTIQVGDGVIYAFSRPPNPGPNVGGYLGRIFPAGSFHGLTFDEMLALGTGQHPITIDERARSNSGDEPEYDSEWRRLFARFEWTLFMHGVGACVALEVLGAARDVVRLENEPKRA